MTAIRYPVSVRRRRNPLLLLAACFLLSAGLNLGLLVGLAYWWRYEPREREPPEQVTVVELKEFDDAEDVEPEADPPRPEEKKKLPPPPKEKPKPEPEIELEELPEDEPEPEPEEEEEEEEEQPEQEKPDFLLSMLKMVEQPDELDEKEAPEDVDFLSNINNDTPENTQAQITNLEKDAVEPDAKQIDPSDTQEPGTSSEDLIAQDEERESQENRQAPAEPPSPQEQRPEQTDPNPKSLLAMRELEQRDHVMAQEEHEALVDEADAGSMQRDQDKQASIAPQEKQARIDRKDKTYKFKLSQNQLEALVGKDKTARRDTESTKESKKAGVWEKQREHYQSPLENFVPEVQPGNQTALRSRKHPFARYIAQMHRKIHEAWAWGFLDQLDGRSRSHPLNDFKLWSRVEIVLNGDGTIDKVITIRHSGKTAFDAAAREIIHSAGPFPNPPAEIRSPNGKIYMHWAFHRDNRACGTFGASPFILDGSGGGDRPDPNKVVKAGKSENMRRLRRKPKAPAIAEGPSRPSGGGGHDHDHDHDHGKSPAPSSRPSLSADPEALADDPGAKKHANAWLNAFYKGDIDRVASRSTLPFRSGNSVVARTRKELKEVLQVMVEEAGGKKPKGARVFTASGLRKVFGSVPAGISEGEAKVYALSRIGGEYFILVLQKKFGAFKVVGIAR